MPWGHLSFVTKWSKRVSYFNIVGFLDFSGSQLLAITCYNCTTREPTTPAISQISSISRSCQITKGDERSMPEAAVHAWLSVMHLKIKLSGNDAAMMQWANCTARSWEAACHHATLDYCLRLGESCGDGQVPTGSGVCNRTVTTVWV